MGCFNQFCQISGRSINKNEEALVIILTPKGKLRRKNDTVSYEAKALPIIGKYDEYGCVELKNLANQKYLISVLNQELKNQVDSMKNKYQAVNITDPSNYFWGTIFDYNYPVTYLSLKVYRSLVKLTLDRLGQRLVPAGYGTQVNNKSFVKKFHNLIAQLK